MAFGFTEPGVPAIPALSAWQNNTGGAAGTTQTFTTNTNNHLTGGASTAGLYPGMGVSGTNIPQGSYITLIVSSTAFDINQAATGSGAQAMTFTYTDPLQSIWIPGAQFPSPSLAAYNTDTPDCPFNIPDTQVLATTATYIPAPGRGLLTMASGTTTASAIQYLIAPTPTWTTVASGTISATVAFFGVMADGVNVRWNNLSATASTFTFYRERSSKSTSV